MRQIDVLASQQQYQRNKPTIPIIEQIKFINENEQNVFNSIRSFGRFNLENCNFSSNAFAMEDYICPNADHETMYKCLNSNDESYADSDGSIVVDFSNNQALIKQSAHLLNDSIVNITLNESRELIENVKMGYIEDFIDPTSPLSSTSEVIEILERNVEDVNANVSERANEIANNVNDIGSPVTAPNQEITIHNCNGTINLKNISNLTINTNCHETDVDRIALETESAIKSAINEENEAHIVQTDKEADIDDQDNCRISNANCEFYERLMNEIKNNYVRKEENIPKKKLLSTLIKSSSQSRGTSTRTSTGSTSSATTTSTLKNIAGCNKIFFKNIKNLKINIPIKGNVLTKARKLEKSKEMVAASENTHPVQIEDWLQQIILETEVEPMQNISILEEAHSPCQGMT